jgi:hypothetical protein
MATVWDEIEKTLTDLYTLPHNRLDRSGRRVVPADEAKRKVKEIQSGLTSVIRKEYVGPRLFLRVAGSETLRIYSGEWWFDVGVLDALEAGFSRIYFDIVDKRRALRDMLRELLAISQEWNQITEIWALELPPGKTLRG